MTVKLTEAERDQLAEACYTARYQRRRTAMSPWSGLRPFQREAARRKVIEDAVSAILADHESARLAAVEALLQPPCENPGCMCADGATIRQGDLRAALRRGTRS